MEIIKNKDAIKEDLEATEKQWKEKPQIVISDFLKSTITYFIIIILILILITRPLTCEITGQTQKSYHFEEFKTMQKEIDNNRIYQTTICKYAGYNLG